MTLSRFIEVTLFFILACFSNVSCTKKEQCSITEISRIELMENGNLIENLDTANNSLSLSVYFDLSCQNIKNADLLNQLEYGSTNIELDRGFVLFGDSVETGKNLAELEYQNLIKGQHTEPIEEYTIWYEFHQQFFQGAEFDSSPYKISFEIKTTDGKTLEASQSLYFKE